MSRIDVVVPCYNYGRFLEQCVSSLLGQEGVDIRVLIIDDASSDDTPFIGQRLAAFDRRVEFRRHVVNQGHITTYNEGLLQWASAKYSLLISADDALAPGALERATWVMDRYNNLGMIYGMALVITGDDDLRRITQTGSNDYRIVTGSQLLQRCCETCFNPVPTPTAVVRTRFQHYLGGYRADFPHTGDMEMWMRFAAHTEVGVLRAVQGYYRWHGANMSSRYYDQVLSDRREFAHTCKSAFVSWRAQLPECGHWLKSMSQRLDEQAFGWASRAFNRGDMAQCRAWQEFGEEISANLPRSAPWWRLRAKRLLGQALWQTIRPAWNRFRGICSPEDSPLRPLTGIEIGWWPGSL